MDRVVNTVAPPILILYRASWKFNIPDAAPPVIAWRTENGREEEAQGCPLPIGVSIDP